MTAPDSASMSYDDWANAIAAFFFDEAHDGEEVLFAVDDTSLAEASGLAEDVAADSLCKVVRLEVGRHWSLANIAHLTQAWRRRGAEGAHPALPFLALTVLAASRMGADEALAPHNYYRPLRRLVDTSDNGRGEPGDFTEWIEYLWKDLGRWANSDLAGRSGRIVLRPPGHHRYVGLAIQHALVRGGDVRHLDTFFRRIGLEPGEMVPPPELRRALAAWVGMRTEPWARRLRRLAEDPELNSYCEALLERGARQWDGRLRDPRTGRPIGRVRVGIDSKRHPDVGLYAQWDERLPSDATLVTPSGGEVALHRWEGWYEPLPLPDVDVASALVDGLDSSRDGCGFTLRAEDAYALAQDDDLGRWVSVDSIEYGVRYQLLVWRTSASEVADFLKTVAAEWEQVQRSPSWRLPPGWVFFRDVRIDARPTAEPPSPLAPLIRSGSSPRLRLVGGLPIGPRPGVYLRGGEPALGLSTLSDADTVQVTCLDDGRTEPVRLKRADVEELPLWELRLGPGRYEIAHGGSTVTMQVVDGIAEAAGPGAGSVVHRGNGDVVASGTRASAQAGRPLPVTVLAPRPGAVAILIGPTSRDVARVTLPTWTREIVGFEPSWKTIDAWVDFDPVWELITDPGGLVEARQLGALEPEPHVPSETEWAGWIGRSTLAPEQPLAAEELWARYRAAAGHSEP
jgi:hypothetical protein